MWYESHLESDFTAQQVWKTFGNSPFGSWVRLAVASSVLLNAPTPEVEVKGHPFAQKGICYNGGTPFQNSF